MSIDDLLSGVRSRRVIDILREKFPDLEWWYEFPYWYNSEGWHVGAYSELAPRYPGDDDSFVTTYRRSDTSARICMF